MRRRRTGPLLNDNGRTLLAAVLTAACALAVAVASETLGPRTPDPSHPNQPAGAASQ